MIFSLGPDRQKRLSRIAVVWLFGVAAAVLLAGCSFDIEIGVDEIKGEGDIRSESYAFDGSFDTARIEDSFDAVVEVGPAASVVVQAHDNLFGHITVEVANGELVVKARDNTSLDGVTNVSITMPSLAQLELSGATSAKVLGLVNSERLAVEVSGASSVSFEEVNAKNLDASISGASDVTLGDVTIERLSLDISGSSEVTAKGQAERASVDVSGASNVMFGSLAIDDAQISVAGASDVDFRTAESVRGDLSGTSHLRVAKTVDIEVDVSGLSEITND